MKKTMKYLLMACLMPMAVQAQTKIETAELSSLYKTTTSKSVSVHDPSVVFNTQDNKFYIYGSHYCGAYTSDLRNWEQWGMVGDYYNTKTDAYSAFKSNPTHKVMRCLPGKTTQEEVTLGSFNASEFCGTYATVQIGDRKPTTVQDWIRGDQWAPDIIWNPIMKKWCYYLSLNGDNWASVVVLMTSDKITGPFTYQAPIVFGGFNGQSYSGKKVDYKNTDLEVVLGTQSTLPARYNTKQWGTYYPNCIDPCVFFDEEGELWIAYGSWSGGIFMLKLDKNTGLRDYTYTYSGTGTSPNANIDDAYFGHRIAGGYYVSGEGPYIQHIGNYYYLFMSYGGFAPDGGYEMRVFRSESPTGPYKDASGNAATYTGYQLNYGSRAATNKGMKLIGAMNHWGTMTVGECAQGHNSACVDNKGRSFLIAHTKFNNGTLGHTVRSYQLYLNKEGWLCTAPFQFNGETVNDDSLANSQPYSATDIEGDYHLIIHPYKLDHTKYEEAEPVNVHLSADGKITGDYKGTWKYTDEGKSYIQISLRGVNTTSTTSTVFSGVVTEQTLENNTAKTLCFTTVCSVSGNVNCGVPVWGYKLQPKSAIALNYQQHSATHLKATNLTTVSKNVELMFDPIENVNIEWISSNPEVISNTGKYNPDTVAVPLTLTARLSCGDWYWENTYNSRAAKATAVTGDAYSGLVAYYNFDETPSANQYNEDQKALFGHSSVKGTAPKLETDYARFGSVCHQYFGAQKDNSYTRMDNPLLGCDTLQGFTVSMWVKRTDDNVWDALWSFFGEKLPAASGPRLFLTGNSYIGFNDNAGNWFDINHPDTKKVSNFSVGTWHLATFTYSLSNGYMFYLNGNKYYSTNLQYNGSATKDAFDRSKVIDFVKSTPYFYLGLGSFWGSADACFDDLMIYDRELTADDVKSLNTLLNRVSDFRPSPAYVLGDVDGDGSVTISDITGLITIYLDETSTPDMKVCDIDSDGVISITDITLLIQMYLEAAN